MARVLRAGSAISVADLTRNHVLVPWAAQSALPHFVIDRAEGCYLYAQDGTRILDFSSGLVCVNVGHCHTKVVEAIRQQAGRLTYVNPIFATEVRARLAHALSRISPGQALVKVFFTNAGADANENAVKIARHFTGRHKILAAYRSYHGATYGAVSLTGDQQRLHAEPGIPGVVHFFRPYPYRSAFSVAPEQESAAALRHLEDVLLNEGPEHVAAILIEPIAGGSGVIVPPDGYLQGVRRLCDQYGILLIFDEVMTGFGRTGAWFASEHWGVVPDMMTFAKGVTSGYVPLGGVMVSERVAQYFDEHTLWAGLTYSGHPLACAAGLANIEVYESEELINRAHRLAGHVEELLRGLARRHPVVGDVRGKGLFWGVELVKDRSTRAPWVPWNSSGQGKMNDLLARVAAQQVSVRGRWNLLIIAPPLVISEKEIEAGVRAIDNALSEMGE